MLTQQLEKLDIPVICEELKVFNFLPTNYINYFVNNQHYRIRKEKNISELITKAKTSLEDFTDDTFISTGYYVEFGN